MCGIIAIVRRRSTRPIPDVDALSTSLTAALAAVPTGTEGDLAARLLDVGERLAAVDRELRGEAGLVAMVGDQAFVAATATVVGQIDERIGVIEAELEARGDTVPDLEAVNGALVALKDAAWSLERDRLRAAAEVVALAGPAVDGGTGTGGAVEPTRSALASLFSIQQALSNLDRLEVRGRDSAGLHVLVRGHGLDLGSGELADLLVDRTDDPLFIDRAVRVVDGHLGFVYKAAAEIGELGDNTASMREAIAVDRLLHRALAGADAEATVLAHTRWASVGIISQPNAHPVNSEELGDRAGPYVTAALNGDVDNFADLIAADSL
ncbi:MAG: glucosamine-6-phosphate synthase, partial [Actinomycetota bacterium]